jgi:hypothetical protein
VVRVYEGSLRVYHQLQAAASTLCDNIAVRQRGRAKATLGRVSRPTFLYERRRADPRATLTPYDISAALSQVQHDLQLVGKSLDAFPGVSPPEPLDDVLEQVLAHPQPQRDAYDLLNHDQRRIFGCVTEAALMPAGRGANLFYVDGPGGTGKTFMYNAIIEHINATDRHAIVVSSSGISAILLKGGRTAHSVFKIPISGLSFDSVCGLSVNTRMAALIRTSALTI